MTKPLGEYVYHASNLPDQSAGLKSMLTRGLQPSRDGYAGPGVYFAYDAEGGFYHVSKEEATMFRVKWADLMTKFGVYPENENGIQRDENEIIVPGAVPADMLEVEYFPGEWWDLKSAYHASLGPVNEAKIDNRAGRGAVPYNQEVDYFGLRVQMKPSTFLSLAAPLNEKDNSEMEEYIRSGGAIGAPFLDIAIPKEWDDGDFTAVAKIQGHEGRHRMRAIMSVEGDTPIEVHLFPKYYRARDLTPDFVKHINAGLYAEKSSKIVRGPLFTASTVSESDTIKLTPPDTKVTDFIDTVYTKYPQTFQNNHVMPLGGTGDDQQFAMFELTPSFSRRGAVEVKWIQAYPLRQGVGGRAMQELQALAKDAGIALTLYPWDKGVVSQAKLTKFYKGQGFKPTVKGAKNMAWTPESLDEAFDQPYAMTWEKSEADDSMDALARLPDGSNLSIMFNMEYDEEGEEVIQVEFHRNNSQEVTGDGDAQRVFATVLAAIQQYIKAHNPKRLTFSASKEVEPDQNSESRAKLYDRLVIRYARTWGYRPLRADTGSIVRYELSRIKQGVAEAETGTAHADQIEKEFTALGYKQVGSGADSTVWAKDKGHIIKILMPDPGSQAEQVFTKFYEFCLAHQNLECLPVINEHNKISVLDREYTQIDMERLSPIKKNSFNEGVVWFFSDFVAGDESWDAVDHALGLSDTWTEYNPRQAANLAKYWQDMTFADDNSKYKELHTLYGVMQILYKAGRINKFGWDLHTDNVMQRKNGQLVIIDPWFADSALTESAQLPEARTNPEQNTRPASGMKELVAVAETIADPENWAISMTSEAKLGINPQVGISEDTPKGIYFYPLDYAVGMIQRRQPLPWGNNLPYIQLFQYDRSGEMIKDTQVDSDKLKQALRQYCSEEVIQSAIDEPEYDGTPYWFIYDCLSRLGKNDETNIVRWNKVLRDLGFTSVFDDGHGWIAYNEPTQGVVLDPRIIKQLRTIDNKKESGVITPALIEQTLFDNLDVELASSRAWQAWDPDGSKLRQHCKEWARGADFKPWLGKDASAVWDETQKLVGLIGYYRRTVGREINNQAWEWYRAQQTQKTESITEGGWASAATQDTVITPAIIVEVVAGLDEFAKEYNTWQAQSELGLEIRMGKPKGSGTYYERDLKQDPTREYGDIDIECFIHSRPGASSAQLITQYKNAIAEFTRHNREFASDNGTNIIMTTSAGPAQVDLIYTFNEHADWSRALSPEYRVKGVISTSLTSALAEVLNFSFSSQGVQVKTRAGRPVSFRQSKDTELTTVSTNPESWARDMFQYYYTLANGQPYADRLLDLDQHPGLKDEQRLADIVHSIRSLATELERNNLLGQGALDHVANASTLLTRVSKIYAQKLEAVINSSKFDKAATPAAEEKAKKTKLMLAKYRNEVAKLLLN